MDRECGSKADWLCAAMRADFSQLIQETRQRAAASHSAAPASAALPTATSETPDDEALARLAEPTAANSGDAAHGYAGSAPVGLLQARGAALGGEPGAVPDSADGVGENGVQETRDASESMWGSDQGDGLHDWPDESRLCVQNSPDR